MANHDKVGRARLSGWGRAGLILLAAHTLLLFLPPIGPNIKGPLISFVAGYTTVLLLLIELAKQHRTVAASWAAAAPRRRRALGLGLAFSVLALGFMLRALSPAWFLVLSAEYGLVEPANLFCYLATAIILFGASGEMEERKRKHWRFIAALYFLMGLEEIDYFGIFGGFIGRIQGVYAGSLHDLIRLSIEGALGPVGAAVVLAVFLVVALTLWRLGYLQPHALAEMLRSRDSLWVVLALGLYLIAVADDAHLFGWQANPPYEEVLELSAAICLAVFALQRLAGQRRRS